MRYFIDGCNGISNRKTKRTETNMQCTTEKNASAEEMVAFLKTGRMTPLFLVESFVALFYRLKKIPVYIF